MELLKLLSTSEIVAQIISFLLLLVLLRVFFWKHLLKLLDDRKARIAGQIKDIEDAKLDIEKLRSDFETKLSSIDEIAREKIKEAGELSKKMAEQSKKDANLEAENILNAARSNIKYEIAKAKEELKDQIIDLTIKATANLVSEKLTEEDDKRIVGDFLDKIDGVGK